MFALKKILAFSLAVIAAVVFTGCSSSDNDTTDDGRLAYSGITEAAVIDAANAQALSTKALGVGFLDGSDAELAPLKKSMEILAGPATKGAESAPGLSMVQLLGEYGGEIISAFYPMVDGPIVPEVSEYSDFFDADFPNESGSFTEDIAETTVGDKLRYAGTLTFVEAAHCTGHDGDICTGKYTYDGAVALTVEFLKSDVEDIADLPEDPFEKLIVLLDDETGIDYVLKTVSTTELFTIGYAGLSNGFGPVDTDGHFSGYNGTCKATYAIDGTATWTETDTDTRNEDGYGEAKTTTALSFVGDMNIDATVESPEGDLTLDFGASNTTITLDTLRHKKSPATIQAETPFEVTDTGRIFTLAVEGDATLNFTAETHADTLTLDAALDGGSVDLSLIFGASSETRYAEAADDSLNETLIISKDRTYADVTGDLAGKVAIKAVYATTLVSPVSQTLGMSLNLGQVTFDYKDQGHREYALDESGAPTPEDQSDPIVRNYATDITVALDADLTLTNGVEPISLVGDLDFAMTMTEIYDEEYPELDDETCAGTLTLDELTVKAGIVDTTVQGTIAFDVDEAAEEKYSSDAPTLSLAMDLLLRNNAEGKTYWFNDYTVGILLDILDYDTDKGPSYGDDIIKRGTPISVSGRFYHPDYGYVDLTTGATPFFMNLGAMELAGATLIGETSFESDDNLDLFLSTLFPIDGEMVLNGKAGSSARLKAENTSVTLTPSDRVIPPTAPTLLIGSGYTLAVDADGDGTFETETRHTWPDLKEPAESIWLLRLGMDVVEWLGAFHIF